MHFLAVLVFAFASSAAAQGAADISCEPPTLPVYEGIVATCIEPNVSCFEDDPPTYLGNGEWRCDTAGEIRFRRGPQVSCSDGAVAWDSSREDWYCEQLSECESCNRCDLHVEIAKNTCIAKSERKARSLCGGAHGVTWRGETVDPAGRSCETIQRQEGDKLKPVLANCTGPAIDACVEGWMASHPGETAGTSSSGSVSYKIGAKGGGKILGIGVEVSGERATQDTKGESYSASWGGGNGFRAACAQGASKVSDECPDCTDVCGE